MFYRDDRLAVLIDAANLQNATKQLPWDIDFKRLREKLANSSVLVRITYYTALREDQEFQAIRPLVDWLQYNGYCVRSKPVKTHTNPLTGEVKQKGNMDIEIAVDALELANASNRVDHIILMTGDGDFIPLIGSLQRQGVRVTVVFPRGIGIPMLADELRRQADIFIDLEDWRESIQKQTRS